jgi:hypothetical protein
MAFIYVVNNHKGHNGVAKTRGKKCHKCNEGFQLDQCVVRVQQNGRYINYHIEHYLDARGNQIYDRPKQIGICRLRV